VKTEGNEREPNYWANYIKQSRSRETDSRSESQEIILVLWNLEVHYRVENSQLVGSILYPVHILTHTIY
jgi:hypothetical protein